MIGRIVHPTDLSELSASAFFHALRLAVSAQCELDLLHVKLHREHDHWGSFPHVREFLVRWGIMDAEDAPSDIPAKTGIAVRKVEIDHRDGPAAGVFSYIAQHPAGLIVTAPHEHSALERWASGSVSQLIARKTHRPTLFMGERMKPFVDADSGALSIQTVLVPIDHHPNPSRVINHLTHLLASFDIAPEYQLLHIGNDIPEVVNSDGQKVPVTQAVGPIVQAILDYAEECNADLVAMPTAGHNGFLDILRGSTTERVMRASRCPLLAIPA